MDFREINRWTTVDRYPAAELQDCLHRVAGTTCYSSIYLKAGFRTRPTHPDSQRFTGKVTKDSAYLYLCLQFGLTNAQAHFQRTVVTIIYCGNMSVVVYLDDIVIYGMDHVRVWAETKLVLEQLAVAGFMINTAKLHFLVSEVKMLGYQLYGGYRFPSYM